MEGSTTTRAVDTRQYISDTFSDKPVHVSYNRRDLIVYAIGIGSKDLRYVYEDHEDFAAFPTYPIVLSFKGKTLSLSLSVCCEALSLSRFLSE